MIKNEFSLNNSIIIYITKRSTPHNTKDIHRQMLRNISIESDDPHVI